jgi:hypothetical protein
MKFPYLVNFDPTPAGHSIDIRSLAQNVHGLFLTSQRRIFMVASAVSLVASYAHVRSAAVLVDEFDAGRFQSASNRLVTVSRHGRLTAG